MSNLTSELKFDFSKVTAKFMTQFFKANSSNDYETMANIFATVITDCPASWGSPNNPDTYLNIPFYPDFKHVMSEFVDGMKAEGKK